MRGKVMQRLQLFLFLSGGDYFSAKMYFLMRISGKKKHPEAEKTIWILPDLKSLKEGDEIY